MRKLALFVTCAAYAVTAAFAQDAYVIPVRDVSCPETAETCQEHDAIVFVHGIYGAPETFQNPRTNFNWPTAIPNEIEGRKVDVFLLNYTTTLLSWAKKRNTTFDELGDAVLDELAPLRRRQYRSIGFIAHSLGGNVVSTYLHSVKSRYGHPALAAHAFAINIATPAVGSHVADIGHQFKTALGMSDDLLRSLKRDDVYQRMLLNFQNYTGGKSIDLKCRRTDYHVAYETKALAAIMIVQAESARRLKERDEEAARKVLLKLKQEFERNFALCRKYADGTAEPPQTGYRMPKWQESCVNLKKPTLESARSYVFASKHAASMDRPSSVSDVVTSEPVPFNYDHSSIVKPTGADHPVYAWVDRILLEEFKRLEEHSKFRSNVPSERKLCEHQDYVAER